MRFHSYNPLVTTTYYDALGADTSLADLEKQYKDYAFQIETHLSPMPPPANVLQPIDTRLAEHRRLRSEDDYRQFLHVFIDESPALIAFLRKNFRYSQKTDKVHPLGANDLNVLFGYYNISTNYMNLVKYGVSEKLFSAVDPTKPVVSAIAPTPAVTEPSNGITAADEPAAPTDRIPDADKRPSITAPVTRPPSEVKKEGLSPLVIVLLLAGGVTAFYLFARRLK